MRGAVLFVDDEPEMRKLVQLELGEMGFEVTTACDAAQALWELTQMHVVDVVITDNRMPRGSGIDLCRQIGVERPGLPVIVLTGFGTMDLAVEALRAGAYDFVTKPIDMKLLQLAASRAVEQSRLKREVNRLGRALRRQRGFGSLTGESSPMKRLFDRLHRISTTDVSVLITGESGTGKELVARGLHAQSRRAKGPFVAINCSALPEQLLESELFGHVKGAFTGAREAHQGLFMQADGGTLLLDEIGEMPLALQPKLLRALEDRTIRPVGGKRELAFDVRIVAATNRDLEVSVAAKEFRADLYYRLNVVDVELPPMRVRGADCLILAHEFLEHFARRHKRSTTEISVPAAQCLMDYSWPGNVRELRNAIERAVAMSEGTVLELDDLPARVRAATPGAPATPAGFEGLTSLAVVERQYVRHVLENVGGNKSLASRILKIDRKTLRKKLTIDDDESAS